MAKICPFCGAPNNEHAKYCADCNRSLNENLIVEKPFLDDEELDGIPVEQFRAFVGPKADYYISVWRKLKKEKKKLSMNFAAFFGGYIWMAARKMYKQAIILMLCLVSVNIVLSVCGGFVLAPKALALSQTEKITYDQVYSKKLAALKDLMSKYGPNFSLHMDEIDPSIEAETQALLEKYDTYNEVLYDFNFALSIWKLIDSFILLLLFVSIAFFANRLYFLHAKKKILIIKQSAANGNVNLKDLEISGGVKISSGMLFFFLGGFFVGIIENFLLKGIAFLLAQAI